MNQQLRYSPTPINAIGRGLLAATVGTAAMDIVSFLKFRHEGGRQPFTEWETGANVTTWSEASAPGQIGKRLYEGLTQRELTNDRARLTNNAVHWATGLAWGVGFGIVVGSSRRSPLWGALLGTTAWLTSYAVLPATGLYKQIHEYDAATLTKDLGIHLVYGLATSAAFAALQPKVAK
jgi:hypothetical protein